MKPHYIKEWREYRGLTQQEVADASGVPQSTVSRIEIADECKITNFFAIAKALQCTMVDVLSPPPARRPDPQLPEDRTPLAKEEDPHESLEALGSGYKPTPQGDDSPSTKDREYQEDARLEVVRQMVDLVKDMGPSERKCVFQSAEAIFGMLLP